MNDDSTVLQCHISYNYMVKYSCNYQNLIFYKIDRQMTWEIGSFIHVKGV